MPEGDVARGLERREKEGPGSLEIGQGWGFLGRSHTQQLCVCPSQQLVEDMEVPLPVELLHHSGLLKQIWEGGRKHPPQSPGDSQLTSSPPPILPRAPVLLRVAEFLGT